MTVADWALVISIGSLVVSLAGFIWNVWSKFIYPRAKVRTHISLMVILSGGGPERKVIALSATNFGPTEITLHSQCAKRRQGILWFRRNRFLAMINPVEHPESDTATGFIAKDFPKTLAVGEAVTVYFSASAPKRWVEEADLFWFGFADTFGRYHWCSRSTARKFRQDIIEEFGASPPKRPGSLASIWATFWSVASGLGGRFRRSVANAKASIRGRLKRR